MQKSRRGFLKKIAGISGTLLLGSEGNSAASPGPSNKDQFGVLVDTTLCVGCRSCERACNEINDDLPGKPIDYFKDESVINHRRRMDAGAYTVVNRYDNPLIQSGPVYTKFQCMHCLYPACVSACIVGAFTREPNGAVIYDPWKCIGCRYCMAACPFQVPAYEYRNVLTPQVRKCTFCFEKKLVKGEVPACVQSCPMEVMTFGKRDELIRLAKSKIKRNSKRYIPHIYGEHEVGGTSWLYLSGVSFQEIDFPRLGYYPAPGYTEPIQHAIFKWFLPPLGLYATLGSIMWYLNSKKKKQILTPERHEK